LGQSFLVRGIIMDRKLIIVIVSYNTKDITRNCLNSLIKAIDKIDNEVWVIDNYSSDNSAIMIKNEFPWVRLVENPENVGFAKANNQILRCAKGTDYLLLNSDTEVPSTAINSLIKYLDNNPDIAAVGPKLVNKRGIPQKIPSTLPTIKGELEECLSYHFYPFTIIFKKLFKVIQHQENETTKRVDILSMACLLLRDEVIKRIGLLGEEFFLFSEENDYFFRMKKAGFRSMFLSNITVVHLVGESRKEKKEYESDIHYYRSRLLFYKKHYVLKGYIVKALYLTFMGWSFIIGKIFAILKRKKYHPRQMYSALLRNVWNTNITN
jgi:GT2 family glycosyltransferase